MQFGTCSAFIAQPKSVFPGAIRGLPLATEPRPSVPKTLGRSRLQRPRSPGRLNGHSWAASCRLRRLAAGRRTRRCPGLQSQVREDLLDHRPLRDGGDDHEFPAAILAASALVSNDEGAGEAASRKRRSVELTFTTIRLWPSLDYASRASWLRATAVSYSLAVIKTMLDPKPAAFC